MPILQGDIQLRASRVMDDVPEGGGGPSNVVIESGQENAIMPDVSEMDRAIGRDNMRQMFVGVDTEDRDTYQGSNVIVAKPPEDPNISITLFATGGVYDTRAQAHARWALLAMGGQVGGACGRCAVLAARAHHGGAVVGCVAWQRRPLD